MSTCADEDYGDESDEDLPENVERVLPREFCQRTFDHLKTSMKLADRAIEMDDPQLRDLDAAAKQCVAAVTNRNAYSLENATGKCRAVLDQIAHKAEAEAAAELQDGAVLPRTTARLRDGPSICHGRSDLPLHQWRPGGLHHAAGDAEEKWAADVINSDEEPAQVCSEESPAPEPAQSDEPLADTELLRKKEQADSMTRDGDFAGAYIVYEQLLEEVHSLAAEEVPTALLVALFSNSALCALKLSAMQGTWSRAHLMLQRTLKMCSKALELDPTHAKAHFRRACALEALEKFSEAHEAYSRAARYEPADPRINSGIDRSFRYLEAELGPDRLEKELKRRGLLKGQESILRPMKMGARMRRSDTAATALSSCVRCSSEAGKGWCAVPCGHGPFCGTCKAWIESEGKGLSICPICKRHPAVAPGPGIISRWEEGFGESIPAPDADRLRTLAEEREEKRKKWRSSREDLPNKAGNTFLSTSYAFLTGQSFLCERMMSSNLEVQTVLIVLVHNMR